VSTDICQFVADLKSQGPDGTIIYANGGGEMFSELVRGGLVDEIILSVHPSIQGDGPLLFPGTIPCRPLKLLDCRYWPSGYVQLKYEILHQSINKDVCLDKRDRITVLCTNNHFILTFHVVIGVQ